MAFMAVTGTDMKRSDLDRCGYKGHIGLAPKTQIRPGRLAGVRLRLNHLLQKSTVHRKFYVLQGHSRGGGGGCSAGTDVCPFCGAGYFRSKLCAVLSFWSPARRCSKQQFSAQFWRPQKKKKKKKLASLPLRPVTRRERALSQNNPAARKNLRCTVKF